MHDSVFAEANVERCGEHGTIGLFHDHYIDGTSQRRRVHLVVEPAAKFIYKNY